MAKQRVTYSCQACSYRPPKWVGCCPACNEWDTIQETILSATSYASTQTKEIKLQSLSDIQTQTKQRLHTSIQEWDRVLGGGIMRSSLLMLSGQPGIGKSTLLLHVADRLAQNYNVIYFSSEESLQQLKSRAERICTPSARLLCSDEAQLDRILSTGLAQKPDVIIIDSIQNCYSTESQILPGSIGQLREAGFKLMRLAKEHDIAIIATGHVNKEGNVAGPKMLEHMVDAVFYLHAEDRLQTRVLRAVKNRFGPVGELGFFQMQANGLQEVANINQYLINQSVESPGAALTSTIEGSRSFLVELQALAVPTKYGMAQRVITGIDQKQVLLIAAILEKYLHIKFSSHDLFVKVSGGFYVKDPAADLAIALSLLSSYFQEPIPAKSIALAELSLAGTIKPVNHVDVHIKEAQKFGITKLFSSNRQDCDKADLKIQTFSSVYQLISLFSKPD